MGFGTRSRMVAAVAIVATAIGCTAENDRVLPTVDGSGDVTVLTLVDLPPTLEPQFLWSYRVVREVPTERGSGGDPLVFEPEKVLPLAGGDLLVFDPTADRPLVIVAPASATSRARFGRSGQGPGELGSYLTLSEREGELLVLDLANRQLHRFDPDGTPRSSTAFDLAGRAGKTLLGPDRDGFLIEGFRSSDQEWYRVLERVAIDGGEVSYLFRLPDPTPRAEPGRIQQGRVIWTVLGSGIVAMWSSRPEVMIYSPEAGATSELRLPLSQRQLTEGDIQRQVALYGSVAAGQRPGPTSITNELFLVNDTIFAMLLSNNRRAAEDPELPNGELWWRMFTVGGEYVGVLRPPGSYEDFRVLFSGNGRVWARALDPRGLPVLQELAIVRSDGAEIPAS